MLEPRRIVLAAVVIVSLALSAPRAQARICGDDIDGVRVPCDCGGVVVSNTKLLPGDPVLSRRCPRDGLVIRTPPTAESLLLDLNGQSLRGQGRGMGVMVEHGGSDGATVIGSDGLRLAEIAGFYYGVMAPLPTSLARLERVVAKGNRQGGFWLRQHGAVVIDVAAYRNGGAGFRITGLGGRFLGLRADENAGRGISVSSRGAIIGGSANFNRAPGIVSSGPRSVLRHVEAHGNQGPGLALRNRRQTVLERVESGNHQRRLAAQVERRGEVTQ